MKKRRVLIFDDDYYALKWSVVLLTRDERTLVCGEAQTPEELMRLAETCHPEDILLEADYVPQDPPLCDLLNRLRALLPKTTLICLAKTVHVDSIQAALLNGASGYLIKNEVSMGLVPAIRRARPGLWLITAGVEQALQELAVKANVPLEKIQSWRPNPRLTPKLLVSFFYRVVYGMRAPSAASKVFVQPETIEKYMTRAYEILENDDSVEAGDLQEVELEKLSPEDRAMHWFTALPKRRWK